ncbi:MAG TPA: glycosyltransferase family 39 protein [Patescibacteria group bacterium]|nr:glycosyltransferase family 39 protein [Patescibacteria group bacterium]
MKKIFSTKLILFAILIIAATFRLYGLNWDQGFHLHPDERAIILTVEHLSFPPNFEAFFNSNSPWNPHFFAYGSLPFYTVYIVGQLLTPIDPNFSTYLLLHIPGRFLSVISDLLTIIIVFFIAKKLFNEKVGLLAAFFYGISVLPIQLSHFYAVDTPLTFFILTTLYLVLLFYEKPTIKKALLIGITFGMALATKVSAFVLVVAIGASLLHKPKHYRSHVSQFIKQFLTYSFFIIITTILIFLFFSPYALIDFENFWLQTMQQQAMTKDAFTFPYTLQYINKIPYLYELKNIFFFGLGPLLAISAFVGFFFFLSESIKELVEKKSAQKIILIIFFIIYFGIVGNFAIGFMRYMLPLYPLLCLFAAFITFRFLLFLKDKTKNQFILTTYYILLTTVFLIWPLSFIQIYHHNNTRVDATNWIHQHIPYHSTLLVEHWDDRLPLQASENYFIEDLELYNPDTPEKWQKINDQLQRADYIIIASNRLYLPLPKLTDCVNLPMHRCYPETTKYYKKLFNGELGFQKVAEFSRYPTIPLTSITINDQNADESFTVYDHPKVMIFKKIN